MKTLGEIQRQLSLGEFEFSRHALKRVVERNISELEIKEAGRNAKIIEEYPGDKYTSSCLLLGFTNIERPIHIQVSLADTEFVKIVTVYEPSEDEWINYSKRR
ncbi:MAG: DUF4258 domain-containing protein [Candidatus Scalinduaceae bacterium]